MRRGSGSLTPGSLTLPGAIASRIPKKVRMLYLPIRSDTSRVAGGQSGRVAGAKRSVPRERRPWHGSRCGLPRPPGMLPTRNEVLGMTLAPGPDRSRHPGRTRRDGLTLWYGAPLRSCRRHRASFHGPVEIVGMSVIRTNPGPTPRDMEGRGSRSTNGSGSTSSRRSSAGRLKPATCCRRSNNWPPPMTIARSTVRQALAALERDGLIHGSRGRERSSTRKRRVRSRPDLDVFALVLPGDATGFYPSLQRSSTRPPGTSTTRSWSASRTTTSTDKATSSSS